MIRRARHTALRDAAIQVIFVTIALAACETRVAEVRRYSGVSVARNATLTKGDVMVTNRNGSVWIDTAGRTGEVDVVGRAFATGADDTAAEASAAAAMATLELSVAPDASGGVVVSGGGDDSRGFDLVVHLPYPFGGLLTITAVHGYVHYVGSSGARGATINVTEGDIFVQDGGRGLTITGGQSNIDIITLPTITGTSVVTDDGDIRMQVPDAANLLITATAMTGGTVTPPPDRSVEEGADPSDTSDGPASGATSTVAPDHKSATIQLGDPQTIQDLNQYLTVSTGHGNVVFR
jgi:hypothetical protein